MNDVEQDVILNVKSKGEENIDKISKKTKDLKSETKNFGNESVVASEKGKKGFRGLDSAVKATAKGFNLLGGAMKAAGIGLVIAVVAKLTQVFSENQRIVDAVSIVMQTVSTVVNQVTNAITNAYDSVSEATNGFESLTSVVKGLVTIALTPMKLTFDAIKLTLQSAQLAWEQSFFGDGDPETIKRLQKDIDETKQSLIDTGQEAIKSGKDIADNIGDAVGEVSDFVSEVSKGIEKISIAAANASSERIVQLRNEAKLAEAELGGLTLKYQKQAEELRQERDDIRLSIDERIKANQELGEVLRRQAEEELALKQKKLSLAREELALNPENIDAQVALQEALNGVADVEERITGQKSEQRVNEAALLDERKANLAELEKIGKTEQEIRASELKDTLENQKQLIERTVSNEKQKNELLLEAEREYRENLQALEEEKESERLERIKEIRDEFRDETETERIDREEEARLEELKKLKASEEAKNEVVRFYKKQRLKIKEEEEKASEELKSKEAKADKEMTDTIIGNSLRLGSVLAEQFGLAKEFAVAQALINTYQGITTALAQPTPLPVKILEIATISATGFASVKDILSQDGPAGSGGSAGGRGGEQPQAPQEPAFNIVGSVQGQLAGGVGGFESEQEPIEAYVVTGSVTTGQELERNAINSSSL